MAQNFNNNIDKVGFYYLKLLKATITKTSFNNSLKESPFYPSLYSLSHTLDKFKISNSSFNIEKGNIKDVPSPFIAYLKKDRVGEEFVAVSFSSSNIINYSKDGKNVISEPTDEFLKRFMNVILVAKLGENSGELNYKSKRKAEVAKVTKKVLSIVSGILIFIIAFIKVRDSTFNIFSFVILGLIEVAGLSISLLLLAYEIDKTNVFIKNICSGVKGKSDCDAVLSSNVSKILGISWSEIAFIYFTALIAFTIFPSISLQIKTPYLALAFTIAAGYIPFSIYYQYKVIKNWCLLCLATQFILLTGLLWSIINYWSVDSRILQINSSIITLLVVCAISPVILWLLSKPILIEAKNAQEANIAYKKILYNPDIFYGVLYQQSKASDGWNTLGIDIGNLNAKTTIIKVCNPYCNPCARAHPILENIIEQNNNVNLKIIFASSSIEQDQKNIVIMHLLAIAGRGDIVQTKRAINDWYSAPVKDYAIFSQKYPLIEELNMQKEKIEAMRMWCEDSSITYTPTIFINGWKLPDNYDINELKEIL